MALILSGALSIRDESHEVNVIAQIEGVADDKGDLCARQHFAILVDPVFVDTITDLKERIPALALNVRADTQDLQVSFHPLVVGCHLEQCQRAVISSVINIAEPCTPLTGFAGRDDVDFNGNGLPIDGNRRRVAHV